MMMLMVVVVVMMMIVVVMVDQMFRYKKENLRSFITCE